MNGKELIFATFSHKETPRVPWVPFAGVHAGSLLGYAADEVLQDGEKLLQADLEVHRLYMPDGIPVHFDLQLEAEILGSELRWAKDNPPSILTHPLAAATEVPSFDIKETDGRIPHVLHAMRGLKDKIGDETAIYGLFCGPFTLASHLRGTALYLDMKRKPEFVKQLMAEMVNVSKRMVDFYAAAGADIIAPVDPVVSQISPKHFQAFLSEPYTEVLDYIRQKGRFSSFFVCGNAIRVLEEMAKTKPDGISIDENIPMSEAKAITDKYDIVIGGNIPLTTTMMFGTQMDNMKYVIDMLDSLGHKNLIVSPGCDMPYNCPPENSIAVAEAVRETDKYREAVKHYEAVDDTIEVDIPDYAHLQRPLIELFSLDSASCAACTYMWNVVLDAKEKYGAHIDIIEHKYTTREGIAQCRAVGVKNLPSIYINGELAYASIIPDVDDFYAEIDRRL